MYKRQNTISPPGTLAAVYTVKQATNIINTINTVIKIAPPPGTNFLNEFVRNQGGTNKKNGVVGKISSRSFHGHIARRLHFAPSPLSSKPARKFTRGGVLSYRAWYMVDSCAIKVVRYAPFSPETSITGGVFTGNQLDRRAHSIGPLVRNRR